MEVTQIIAILSVAAVMGLTLREIWLYIAGQRERTELYPYTRERLARRVMISAFLIMEILLLFIYRPDFQASKLWIGVYVAVVIVLFLLMAFLTWMDLKESQAMHLVSQKRLMDEFIQEIQQDIETPVRH